MVHAVFIIRHGMRADFEDAQWTARSPRPWDPPLSASGERMAEETAQALSAVGIRRIFSSPFLRAVQTAAPLAKRCGAPVCIEPGFMEFLLPAYMPWAPDFLGVDELKRFCTAVDRHWTPKVAVRWPEIHEKTWGAERVRKALDAVDLEGEGPVAIFTHGAITHNAVYVLTGDREKACIGLCAINTVVRTPQGWKLESADQSHLSATEGALRFS